MRPILCALMFVCAAVSFAMAQDKPAEQSDALQAVKTRFREYSEALTKHDLAALDKIWAEGYTFTNGRGEFLTKKQRMENIRTGATKFESISREGEDIRIFGDDTAVATSRVDLKVKYSGKESSGPYRSINVWAKINGSWQIVANQITPITP